jgi:hypothetical protein
MGLPVRRDADVPILPLSLHKHKRCGLVGRAHQRLSAEVQPHTRTTQTKNRTVSADTNDLPDSTLCVPDVSADAGIVDTSVADGGVAVAPTPVNATAAAATAAVRSRIAPLCLALPANRTEQNRTERFSGFQLPMLSTVYPPNVAACPDGLKHSV